MAQDAGKTNTENSAASSETSVAVEDLASPSIFSRAWHAGPVVFGVLLILVAFSIMSWAILVWKMIVLRKNTKSSDVFIKSFWDSRSLNDLNSRLGEYAPSPAKEVFRTGYAELVRGSQLKESLPNSSLAISAAMENINRSLSKAKRVERKKLESFLPLLATIASAAPFIGLFGTVWGIMGSFEGIARSGSASLAAVAPGISEALIATAFGLAAAIPAVVAFNTANSKIRSLTGSLDGFTMDFLNIVGRYLVADRKTTGGSNNPATI
ncbi:MAG: Tol-Pal system subunit TolQ [Proteobacteria bacterium]|nr:MAG: Tol-Pal system subunit TolQ [Pseudomonadota bacterium]